jgi:iron complex outermembrane recepter protein
MRSLCRLLCGFLGSVILSVSAAWADDTPHAIAIPAGDLKAALELVMKQTGVELVYRPEQVSGLKTQGAQGTLKAEQAVARLLAGTPLVLSKDASGALLIAPQATRAANYPLDVAKQSPNDKADKEGKKPSSQDFRLAPVDQTTAGTQTVEQNKGQKKDDYLQEVIVTGSRIPTPVGQGVLPVRIYDRQTIEQSGQTTVADFLSSLPDVSVNSADSVTGTGFADQTTVQLHGLPAGTTLVLLNGRRVEIGGDSGFFDLNNIPAAVVERIEVLPVGSSAVYGSDALAGAVNIILRKDFTGLEVNARYGRADETGESDANFGWGTSWDRGSFSIIGSYQDRTPLLGSERSIVATAPQDQVQYCNPGNVSTTDGSNLPGLNSSFAGIPAGIQGKPTVQQFAATAGSVNTCSIGAEVALLSPLQREGAMIAAHHVFSTSADLFFEGIFSHESVPSAIGDLVTISAVFPANNPYNPFGVPVNVAYSYPGVRSYYDRDQTYIRPLLGVRGSMGSRWSYEISGFLSRDWATVLENDRNFPALFAAENSTDPATALNPFTSGAPGSPQLLAGLATPFTNHYTNELISGQAIVRGPLLILPAGDLGSVFGVEYDKIKLYDYSEGTSGDWRRNSYAVFTEERLPLLRPRSDPSGGEILAASAAARYDHSDDFGGKTIGQGGLEWRPTRALLVRAAYAMSYQAPQLQQLYGSSVTYPASGLIDPFRGNQVLVDIPETDGANPNLAPETGRSRTVGIAYSNNEPQGLEASLTYYLIDITNFISTPLDQQFIDFPQLFPGRVTRAPPTAEDLRNGYLGEITSINATTINFGAISVAGIDLDLRYKLGTSLGTFIPSLSLTETTRYKSALVPGAREVDYVSQANLSPAGFAPRWKGTLSLSWNLGSYAAIVSSRYIGEYADYTEFGGSVFPHDLGRYWFCDANLRYSLGQSLAPRSRWLAGTFVEVGAVNLFNRLPQYSYYSNGYDVAEADIRGRFLYAQVGLKL